jgi:hypothetical protein
VTTEVDQLYYEDVTADDLIPEVTFHLTLQRMIMSVASNRDFSRFHHNLTLAQRAGAPDVFLNNTSLTALLERVVTDYIGPGARVKSVGPFRINTFSCPGDTVVGHGKVIRKWIEGELHFVELEVWLEHTRGIAVSPCPIIIALPTRSRTVWPLPKWW